MRERGCQMRHFRAIAQDLAALIEPRLRLESSKAQADFSRLRLSSGSKVQARKAHEPRLSQRFAIFFL